MASDPTRPPSVRWVRAWVPQEAVGGGKFPLLKWVREDQIKALKEKSSEARAEEPKSQPTTEVLFLCSYEGCGRTFIDAGALRKHAQIHGEKQHVCHFDGCGKKFADSSKLKRHHLIHTGERKHVCPFKGCHKAFSLDFNLKAHMRTHSLENYHICPYPECGRRFTQECKLRTHVKAHHEKNTAADAVKRAPLSADKLAGTQKAAPPIATLASSDRPYACPYEGCGKAYIHEYKLNLHLRKEHPGHSIEENGSRDAATTKGSKKRRPDPMQQLLPAKARKASLALLPASLDNDEKQWMSGDEMDVDDGSEETQEGGWAYGGEGNGEEDEETEDED